MPPFSFFVFGGSGLVVCGMVDSDSEQLSTSYKRIGSIGDLSRQLFGSDSFPPNPPADPSTALPFGSRTHSTLVRAGRCFLFVSVPRPLDGLTLRVPTNTALVRAGFLTGSSYPFLSAEIVPGESRGLGRDRKIKLLVSCSEKVRQLHRTLHAA